MRTLKLAAAWFVLLAGLGEGSLRLLAWANRGHLIASRARGLLQRAFEEPSIVERLRRIHPTRVYKNVPNCRTPMFSTNSRGFRGAEFSVEKSSGGPRILCLGDSCVFGWGVDDANTYPALLHKRLARAGLSSAEVINAGVPGYSSWQALAWYREELFRLKPDVLVVYIGWNDLFESRPELGTQLGKGGKMAAYLLRRSFLATELRFALYALREKLGRAAAADENALYRSFEPVFFRHQLRRLVQEAKGHGARVLLLTLPTADRGNPRGAASGRHAYIARNPWKFAILYDRYNDAIRESAREGGVELLDVAGEMNGKEDLFGDFCHPSRKGYAFLANLVARRLLASPRRRGEATSAIHGR